MKTINYETFEEHTVDKDKYLSGYCDFKSIVIPKTVTEIDYATFTYCRNLKSVTIPMSVNFSFRNTKVKKC